MTALPARRAPSRWDDGASTRAFTRSPTTAGSMRRTYDGSGDTVFGASRGAAGRVTAIAGSTSVISGAATNSAAATARRRRRVMEAPVSTVGVLPLIPGAEFAGLQRAPPGLVLAVPAHGRFERGGERMARGPAELSHLRRIDRIASIVTRTVGDAPDQGLRPAREAQDLVRQHDVFDLVTAADVVDLAVAAAAQHEVDGRAVVEDVEPVAHVAAVAVQRERLIVERIRDEQRHDLFGILVRPEVVRRARDDHRHAVRAPVRQGEQVAGGLG